LDALLTYTPSKGSYVHFFAHRRDILQGDEIVLQIPMKDDNGYGHTATFHKIWWGNMHFSEEEDVMYGADVKQLSKKKRKFISDADKTLFISHLPLLSELQDIIDLECGLNSLFKDYGNGLHHHH